MSFSANGTYGKYKHTLNADEMPNHAHNIPALNYEVQGSGATEPTSYEGKNEPFEIIQPSIGAYRWRRIA